MINKITDSLKSIRFNEPLIIAILITFSLSQTLTAKEYSLQAFLTEVSKTHPDSEINDLDLKIAKASYNEFRDQFSPMLASDIIRVSDGTTNQTAPSTNVIVGLGVSKYFLSTGTMVSGKLNTVYTKTPFSGSRVVDLVTPNHQHVDFTTDLSLWSVTPEITISQSLLRGGFYKSPGLKQKEILENTVKLSRSIYNTKKTGLLFSALTLYYNYLLTEKLLSVAEESIADYTSQLERIRRKIKIGTAEETDLYDFEGSLARLQIDLNNSKGEFRNIKNEICYVLDPNKKYDNLNFIPTDSLIVSPSLHDLEKAYEIALSKRKDIEQQKISVQMSSLAYDIAKLTMLPKLDAFLNVKLPSAGGNEKGIGGAFENLNKQGGVDLTVGLNFEVPLDLKALQTVKEKKEIEYYKSKESLLKTKEGVRKEIEKLVQAIEHNRYTMTQQDYVISLMEKKLVVFLKKYENGEIDSMLFVQVQDGLRQWRQLRYVTLFQGNLLDAQLEVAKGTFLEKYNIAESSVNEVVK